MFKAIIPEDKNIKYAKDQQPTVPFTTNTEGELQGGEHYTAHG
jgi:hypothetical protein